MQYTAWKTRLATPYPLVLPPINFDVNKTPLSGSVKSLKRNTARARAINVLWKTDRATPENALWVVQNMQQGLPLVDAVARVEKAKRHLGSAGGRGDLRDLRMRGRAREGGMGGLEGKREELGVLDRVIDVARYVLTEQEELARAVVEEVGVLVRRREELERVIEEERRSSTDEEMWDNEV